MISQYWYLWYPVITYGVGVIVGMIIVGWDDEPPTSLT